jgi:hypothetical protein
MLRKLLITLSGTAADRNAHTACATWCVWLFKGSMPFTRMGSPFVRPKSEGSKGCSRFELCGGRKSGDALLRPFLSKFQNFSCLPGCVVLIGFRIPLN